MESLAERISCFRAGEGVERGVEHVARWLKQFPLESQLPIVRAVDTLMAGQYFGEAELREEVFPSWLRAIESEIAGSSGPVSGFRVLETQTGARKSQAVLREGFLRFTSGSALVVGSDLVDCRHSAAAEERFIYLDDGIFTGGTMKRELEKWVEEKAPNKCDLLILTIVAHSRARDELFGYNGLRHKIEESGKKISILNDGQPVCVRAYEDQSNESMGADTYRLAQRPTVDPESPEGVGLERLDEIWQSLPPNTAGCDSGVFASISDETRAVTTSEFCRVGLRLLSHNTDFKFSPTTNRRPLGFGFKGYGLGSPFVWYANCPNNAPLALWWKSDPKLKEGEPGYWYPLLPRRVEGAYADSD